MPEIISKYPEVVLKVLKGVGVYCGPEFQPRILPAVLIGMILGLIISKRFLKSRK